MPLLTVENLNVSFSSRKGRVEAVKDWGLTLSKGEVIGIAGESGSGKTVAGKALMGLLPRTAEVTAKKMIFDGIDLGAAYIGRDAFLPSQRHGIKRPGAKEKKASQREAATSLKDLRGNRIAMIFQDPMTSLNPYLRIGTQMIEPLMLHRGLDKKEALHQAIQALESVEIPEAHLRIHEYPHQFSGGMRQRVMIAMALMMDPDLIIADEPTTALDVTVQAQVFDLLMKLKGHDASILFISHDMGAIWELCDRVMIMRQGEIVEEGSVTEVFEHPNHAYTRMLIDAVPPLDKALERLPIV